MPVISVRRLSSGGCGCAGYVCAANERWQKVCLQMAQRALRGGRDEGLHQLRAFEARIGRSIGPACGSAD